MDARDHIQTIDNNIKDLLLFLRPIVHIMVHRIRILLTMADEVDGMVHSSIKGIMGM